MNTDFSSGTVGLVIRTETEIEVVKIHVCWAKANIAGFILGNLQHRNFQTTALIYVWIIFNRHSSLFDLTLKLNQQIKRIESFFEFIYCFDRKSRLKSDKCLILDKSVNLYMEWVEANRAAASISCRGFSSISKKRRKAAQSRNYDLIHLCHQSCREGSDSGIWESAKFIFSGLTLTWWVAFYFHGGL